MDRLANLTFLKMGSLYPVWEKNKLTEAKVLYFLLGKEANIWIFSGISFSSDYFSWKLSSENTQSGSQPHKLINVQKSSVCAAQAKVGFLQC